MRRSGFGRRGSGRKAAIKTYVDGIKFDSKLESRLYIDLKTLVLAGFISELELQKEFSLKVSDIHISFIIPDFFYLDNASKQYVVHEAKGYAEELWKHKWKHLKAQHPEFKYEVYTGKPVIIGRKK